VERFDAIVRISRVVLPRLYQESDPANAAVLAVCRRVLDAEGYLRGTEEKARAEEKVKNGERAQNERATERNGVRAPLAENEVLTLIDDRLSGNVSEIRRVASLLRDRISADAWRVLKQLEQEFTDSPPPESLRVSWAQDLLDRAVISLAAFSGLATENMTRGHGWRFLDMGRRLERALQTVHLIRHGLGFGPHSGDAELEGALEIGDSMLTYRSRYLSSLQTDLVLDLLLLDEGNPRSVVYQLAKLSQHVDQLPESHPVSGRPREARLALSMLSSLQLADAGELVTPGEGNRLNGLDELTVRLTDDLALLSEVLSRLYFTHALASRQLSPR